MRNLKRKSTELDENSHPDAEAVKCFIRSVLLTSKDGVLSSELQGTLRKHAHDIYRKYFGFKNDIFLIFAQNIVCGYILEGESNEYP